MLHTMTGLKMPDRDLLGADPVALTQREMLMRLDARFDKYEEDLIERREKVDQKQAALALEQAVINTKLRILGLVLGLVAVPVMGYIMPAVAAGIGQ
jgi:hypothetical protein